MASMEITFYSQCLQRTVEMRAIVPTDEAERPFDAPRPKLPALFLLHGLYGSSIDWLYNTRVALWAREKKLAVVMPSGENAFYVDTAATGEAYARFIGEELPAFCRRLLPISPKRENTFVGGLSMGGYGALLAGFRYPGTFSKVVALSAALSPWVRMREEDGPFVRQRRFADALFGEHPEQWSVPELAKPGLGLYLACGLQDGLLPASRAFVARLHEKNIPVTYVEAEGAHEWTFWDTQLHQAMDWLLPEKEGTRHA